jgi:hypothetical protein
VLLRVYCGNNDAFKRTHLSLSLFCYIRAAAAAPRVLSYGCNKPFAAFKNNKSTEKESGGVQAGGNKPFYITLTTARPRNL